MTIKRSYRLLAPIAGLLGATCLSSAAFASGFGLREGASDWLGNAFAGDEAKAYDASTVWSNPAGMALLQSNEIDADASVIAPSIGFTGSSTDPEIGANTPGTSAASNNIAPAATGSTFGVLTLGPDWRLGFGVTSPYGERVSYPDAWFGRYQSLVSSITDVELSLALSYKVNNQFSVGVGPNIDYFNARLTQAVNIPQLSAGTGEDPINDIHGSNIGVGYNVGALYQFDDNNRIGIDYRSRITHSINGAQDVTVPALYGLLSPPTAAALAAGSSAGKTSITLPDSLSVGYYSQITPKLALLGTLQWTDWSLFNTLTVTPSNGAPASSIYENWRNSWFAAIGANYQLCDRMMLQTGFGYDESPVTNANRTTRIPDANHYDFGVGLQYKLTPAATLEAAYGHVFTPGGSINNTALASPTTPSGTITGKYSDADNSFTAGVTFKF